MPVPEPFLAALIFGVDASHYPTSGAIAPPGVLPADVTDTRQRSQLFCDLDCLLLCESRSFGPGPVQFVEGHFLELHSEGVTGPDVVLLLEVGHSPLNFVLNPF